LSTLFIIKFALSIDSFICQRGENN